VGVVGVVVVVADHLVWLHLQVLQVLQVLPVPKALWAQHFIFWHCTILSLILLFSKWLKL
jgi:hypothetical protein